MPLDPVLADYIATRASEPRPSDMPPAEARAYMAQKRLKLWPQAVGVSAEDVAIPLGWGDCRARLYRAGAGRLPLMVYFHGGGFVVGDLDTHDGLCRSIAGSAGVAVLSVDYRLAPEHPWPAGQDDATAAVRWAQGAAERLAIDPKRIVLGGDSAGGHLAAIAALRLSGDLPVLGQALLYPVTDGPDAAYDSRSALGTGYGLTMDDMAYFWRHYTCGDMPAEAALMQRALAASPPTFLATAEYDLLRDEAETFAARLIGAGVPVQARRYLGVNHNFLAFAGLIPACDALYTDLARWMRALTGETA